MAGGGKKGRLFAKPTEDNTRNDCLQQFERENTKQNKTKQKITLNWTARAIFFLSSFCIL